MAGLVRYSSESANAAGRCELSTMRPEGSRFIRAQSTAIGKGPRREEAMLRRMTSTERGDGIGATNVAQVECIWKIRSNW